ncbi:MAG: beta-glucosidase [Anaerolineae bacterium]|nr:beta-glucosidase [Anaerolineae bacterium]
MSTQKITFPEGFKWGTATASYQVEGAVHEDGRLPSIWDTFSHTPGKVLNGDNGDVACDHYHRYPEDIGLMECLGINAYRFSIAWPRILPSGIGQVNQRGLDFYDRIVDALLAKGIEPFATLYHWDMPQPLEDAGGWPVRSTVDAFVNYADVISRRLGDRVKNWMTINEPWCVSMLGYGIGEHAPGRQNWKDALAAAHHVLLAHGKTVPVLRTNVGAQAKVGMVCNYTPTDPVSNKPEDVAAAQRYDGYFNRWYLEPVLKGQYPADMVEFYKAILPADITADDMKAMAAPTDFFALNYYSRAVVGAGDDDSLLQLRHFKPEGEYTEMPWEVYPQGMYNMLMRVHRDYKPANLYITENGAAFADTLTPDGKVCDERRQAYIEAHLAAAHRAIQDGVPLRGYFVWSLTDNFEWAQGYSKRFGLTYIDYATQKRTLKQSAEWYSHVTRNNGFVPSRK